ncbi:MAG: magnesium transporter [Planctomycetota bacterium]
MPDDLDSSQRRTDEDGAATAVMVPPSVDRRVSSIDVDPENDPAHEVAEAVTDLPEADGALLLNVVDDERASDIVGHLEPASAAGVLSEMESQDAGRLLADMATGEAAAVLHEMDPDDRVDILEHLPEDLHDAVIELMAPEDQAEIRHLESFDPDTAGGIMTTEVTKLYEALDVADAIESLRAQADELEMMFYSYVIDRRGHLVGVLSMRDLILSKPDRKLSDIMRGNVTALPADMDQEEVAELFRKYNYLAMPVVDERHRLIGLVTVDDVVDVLQEEATEDVQVLFGAGAEERLASPWTFSFRSRTPWLVVNLITAFAAAAVVAMFEGIIAQLAVLAAFMPIVAGMGGNASAQAMAVAVRGIGSGNVDRKLLHHVLQREALVGLFTGLIIGVLTGVIAFIWDFRGDGAGAAIALGLVVFAALVINHTLACISGAGIPFIMKRLGFDPAQSATIFATTVTDVVGFFALLGLAALVLT